MVAGYRIMSLGFGLAVLVIAPVGLLIGPGLTQAQTDGPLVVGVAVTSNPGDGDTPTA